MFRSTTQIQRHELCCPNMLGPEDVQISGKFGSVNAIENSKALLFVHLIFVFGTFYCI